jgi:beta-lactamase regulating signal transducer with metallopeptidase domain
VINPETIRVLGWCLLHFVWQGAVLALVLSALLTRLRSPQARYASAVCTLALIMLAPVLTFAVMQPPTDGAQSISGGTLSDARSGSESSQSSATSAGSRQLLSIVDATRSTDWLNYAVLVWFAGVYMFTLRTLGAWMLLMRLRRQHAEPVAGNLLMTCLALQARLGVRRAVRYVCSKSMDSPAVMGWLRPVVVLPLSVLAGLTPWQVEAIIAHELAHIRRWDAFVNLFQVATETLLFYHPAVWWVNRVIRSEREHCCDDVAVAACGNAHGYARALALLEESRCASLLVLAASGGTLSTRIGRLLGVQRATRSMSAPSIAMLAALSIFGALLAGSASTRAIGEVPDPPAPPAPVAAPLPVALNLAPAPVAPLSPVSVPSPVPSPVHMARLATSETSAHRVRESAPSEASSSVEGGSYIGGLQAAGLKDLTVDEIIALKIHGVTPEYIRELSAAGFPNLRVQDYLTARVQGITSEFIQKMRSHGFKDLTLDQLISLKLADIS